MHYVISKLSSGVDYVTYRKTPDGQAIPIGKVTIKGGSDVADRKTLVAPEGVITEISDDQAEALKENSIFVEQMESGYLKLVKTNPVSLEKAVNGLKKDKGAALTASDFTSTGQKPPETGSAK